LTILNGIQDQEVTYLTGINADGTQAATSFWTWNRDANPATYGDTSLQAKWGIPLAGTGGTINVAFAPGQWSATETQAFTAAMHLWSDVANISFNLVSDPTSANLLISRGSDGSAQTWFTNFTAGTVGSPALGSALGAQISIDPSAKGFGPIGSRLDAIGGYPWMTMIHELGHAIGLGHGGPYNEGTTASSTMLTVYDATAWTVMSYIPGDAFFKPGTGGFGWGTAPDGYEYVATTPMMLDIAAAQRIYGLPVNTPLSGGQVFGFHSNIQGDTAPFFDFSINTHPVVTLFDMGTNNMLDLSGYSVGNNVDLHDGAFSSVGGLHQNVGIALGTKIDAAVGGTGGDKLVANDDGDVLMGNAGGDILIGGAGNDHIYGNMAGGAQGLPDGSDTIDAGNGSNYVNGNGGDDFITAGNGTNRLYGGSGNDRILITGTGVGHINGNKGDDLLQVTGGTNDVHGGQGNDTITAMGGTNTLSGDTGDDLIAGGSGVDIMTGGPGADLFVLIGQSGKGASPAGQYDEVTDYMQGVDHLHVNVFTGTMLPTVLHAGQTFADFATAEAYAATLMASVDSPTAEVAALQVGSDTYLFYSNLGWPGEPIDSAVKLDNIAAANITGSDFVANGLQF
jgi:serralysin